MIAISSRNYYIGMLSTISYHAHIPMFSMFDVVITYTDFDKYVQAIKYIIDETDYKFVFMRYEDLLNLDGLVVRENDLSAEDIENVMRNRRDDYELQAEYYLSNIRRDDSSRNILR